MKKILLFPTLLFFALLPMYTYASAFLNHEDLENEEITTEFFDAIQYVKKEGIVNGYSDGTYKPNNTITREEFTTILARILNSEFKSTQYTSNDCILKESSTATLNGQGYIVANMPDTKWFKDVLFDGTHSYAICFAKNNNMLSGFSDGTFRPNAEIEFGAAAKIIANALSLNPDLTLNSEYEKFKGYVLKLEEKKAIPTSLEKIDDKLTRGELAEIIYRIKTDQNKPSKTYAELATTVLVQGVSVSSQIKMQVNNSQAFQCNCSKTCTQITMCAEAYYQLQHCGCSVRDEDNDGVPCESVCK